MYLGQKNHFRKGTVMIVMDMPRLEGNHDYYESSRVINAIIITALIKPEQSG
jgi:hypothetical protein